MAIQIMQLRLKVLQLFLQVFAAIITGYMLFTEKAVKIISEQNLAVMGVVPGATCHPILKIVMPIQWNPFSLTISYTLLLMFLM